MRASPRRRIPNRPLSAWTALSPPLRPGEARSRRCRRPSSGGAGERSEPGPGRPPVPCKCRRPARAPSIRCGWPNGWSPWFGMLMKVAHDGGARPCRPAVPLRSSPPGVGPAGIALIPFSTSERFQDGRVQWYEVEAQNADAVDLTRLRSVRSMTPTLLAASDSQPLLQAHLRSSPVCGLDRSVVALSGFRRPGSSFATPR